MATAGEPETASYPDHLRVRVEAYLQELRFSDASLTSGLEEAMRYSLLAGGKRIRPVLALATARALRRDADEVLPLAAAIELIHTYSLIHDDLPAMDDDDLRRGRPTCHVAFGEDVAILAGDGLYAEAFVHVLTHQKGDPAHVLRALCELAAATGVNGMVGGQYLDVHDAAPAGPRACAACTRSRRAGSSARPWSAYSFLEACPKLRQSPTGATRASSACSSRSSTTSST
jgi:geranylgeranyl diphosphate synthase type II